MKAKFSNLKFKNYILKNSKFSTTLKSGDNVLTVKKKIHNRLFNVDFDIFENADNQNLFYIELVIDSFPNVKRKTSGYDFQISLIANFELENSENIAEEKQNQYVLYSALPMVISIARSEISHITSNGMFGKYILPAINLPELVDEYIKKEQVDE